MCKSEVPQKEGSRVQPADSSHLQQTWKF